MKRRRIPWLAVTLAVVAGMLLAVGFWPGILISALETVTPGIFWRAGTDQKVLALTFDDGPHEVYTPELLQILAGQEVTATFFLVGERARRFPALVEAIRAAGHEIANHSDSLGPTIGLSEREFASNLLRAEETLHLAGADPKFFRPAGGFIWPSQAAAARAQGYTVTLASGYAFDPYRPPVGYMVWQMKRSLNPGAIWVLHDSGGDRSHTLRAVEILIPWAKQQGYRFVALTELAKLSGS
jgi:peptidoglycan/xylan/chitin deacetylase (PgdA/CDA1 family)